MLAKSKKYLYNSNVFPKLVEKKEWNVDQKLNVYWKETFLIFFSKHYIKITLVHNIKVIIQSSQVIIVILVIYNSNIPWFKTMITKAHEVISANAFTTRLILFSLLTGFIFLALTLTILQMDMTFLSCTIWVISSFNPGLWNRGIQCDTKKHLNLQVNHFGQTNGTAAADLSNTKFICKLPSKIKGFALANVDFVLHTPKRFWICSSSIQHIVENYHCPTIWFSTCSKKSFIWLTMSVLPLVKS